MATCRWIAEHRGLLITGPWHREELVSLRARAQGLPRRLVHYARAAPVG